MYVCMCVCIYIYTYMYACMYVCMHVYSGTIVEIGPSQEVPQDQLGDPHFGIFVHSHWNALPVVHDGDRRVLSIDAHVDPARAGIALFVIRRVH